MDIRLIVLPFENLSSQKEHDIFCKAFSTDLATELTRFRQFCLVAYPRKQTFSDATDVLDKLKTDYFIQGNFRCYREIARINVQLCNSETRQLVWGNRFEGTLADLSQLQETVLLEIVGVLQQQINRDLLSKFKKKQQVPLKAYEHWLHGMEELKNGSVESDILARNHFQEALKIQPDYALAYSGMSLTYFNEWTCQLWERWDISKSDAFDWAQKAIELDDQNYIAALVLGKAFLYDGSYETAEYYLNRSLYLNPNDPDTIMTIAANLVFLGKKERAVEIYERASSLGILREAQHFTGAFIYFENSQFEKAASMIVNSSRSSWADADAYNAAICFFVGDEKRMRTHWLAFLDHYSRLISKGNAYTEAEAIEWLLNVNPHKQPGNLPKFLAHLQGTPVQFSRAAASVDADTTHENTFIRENSIWRLSFNAITVRLPEIKGFYDIQRLVTTPHEVLHCMDLMGAAVTAPGEKVFDTRARLEYKKRILELQSELAEAEQTGNLLHTESLQEEYDQLVEHLSQSLGLKGRVRERGNPVEKARSAVTWRIRNAIARIEQAHPELGAHLSNAIKTGTLCSYQPDRATHLIT